VSVNKEGKGFTIQFFLEGGAVTVLGSFLYHTPSGFSIETIEDFKFSMLSKRDFELLLKNQHDFRDWFLPVWGAEIDCTFQQAFNNYGQYPTRTICQIDGRATGINPKNPSAFYYFLSRDHESFLKPDQKKKDELINKCYRLTFLQGLTLGEMI